MTQLLIVIAIIAAFLIWSTLKKAPKARQRQWRNKALIFGGIALLLLGVLTGKLNPLIAALVAAVPALLRLASLVTAAKGIGGLFGGAPTAGEPSSGQRSEVVCEYLKMSLDHDTGTLEGIVLKGSFQGRALSSLSDHEMSALYDECAHNDEQSRALLDAYLNRERESWRTGGDNHSSGTNMPASGAMSRREAAAVLGVAEDAHRETVVAAHRRLMQRMHPDRGGSDYLAAKINEAKETLLKA